MFTNHDVFRVFFDVNVRENISNEFHFLEARTLRVFDFREFLLQLDQRVRGGCGLSAEWTHVHRGRPQDAADEQHHGTRKTNAS